VAAERGGEEGNGDRTLEKRRPVWVGAMEEAGVSGPFVSCK